MAGHNKGQERRSQQPFPSLTELDPREGGHRVSDGLIKAKTTAGSQGFLVGYFEGFKAQAFVTEVPNLALEEEEATRTYLWRFFASPRPQISGTSLQIMSRASLYMWSVSIRIAHAMPP